MYDAYFLRLCGVSCGNYENVQSCSKLIKVSLLKVESVMIHSSCIPYMVIKRSLDVFTVNTVYMLKHGVRRKAIFLAIRSLSRTHNAVGSKLMLFPSSVRNFKVILTLKVREDDDRQRPRGVECAHRAINAST